MSTHFHPKFGVNGSRIRTGAIALALFSTLLTACGNNDRPIAGGPTGASNVTTEEVADETVELIGKPVTIRDEVEQKVSPVAFTIENDELFGDEEILVVNASGKPLVLPEDDADVQVTGTVARFVTADINREYNLGLDPNVYVKYESKPAIIARSLALAPEPGEITKNPSLYYGKVIAVPAEVEEIVGPNAFTLDEEQLIGSNDLLVLVPNPQRPIQENQKVVVTGVLRPFVLAELERDYDFTWDSGLQRTLEAEYRQKPVLVATDVYPSATPATQR
ncbi:MAG: hypothetical protein SAK29_15045 [Scytonema sp. PMC 1069.18]|nr:hypothetical protein [Scytonema sp. PMC 1069.18]MEC4887191.1 hypothetical protein [Scytonema sp. PMC 1070.18]